MYEYDVSKVAHKEDIDDIINSMTIPSINGNWKIYILDEAHLMSQNAMGSLLKILEEPPEKVLIMLCTTDPDKLLDTIVNRCQQVLTITKPSRSELCKLLAFVCESEGIKYDMKALNSLAVSSGFVPRMALVLLERVVQQKKDVFYENVIECINVISTATYNEFFEILTADKIDYLRYIKFLSEVKTRVQLKQFVADLLEFVKRGIYVYNDIAVDGLDELELESYQKLFKKFKADDIVFIINTLLDMKSSQDIEIKLMKLGFTGVLQKEKNIDIQKEVEADINVSASASAELNYGMETNRGKSIATEKDINVLISESTKKLSGADVLSLFNAKKVQ
jgi:DNA polymerase-3 subunit gamma/tau